jgi:hypothetical protein
MYKYKSTCRFKMLVYSGSDILEIRPQQIIESEVLLDHPYLRLLEEKVKPKKTYKPRKKKETLANGDNRQTDN